MIKGSELLGRAVVDMEAAEKLGKIKEVIVEEDGERVAGFVVLHGENVIGSGGTRRTIPATALNAIGPDAVVVRLAGTAGQPTAQLEDLPGMSDVIGHKMVTQSGRLLGAIDDILIDEKDGTVIGFVVGEGMKSKLENIFNSDRAVHGYVRADADLHVGNDLIVVPDDAFVPGDWERPGKDVPVTPPAESVRERTGWATLRPEKAAGTRTWKRRATEGGSAATGSPEVEGWIPGDFAQAFSGESKPTDKSARETPDLPASPFPPDRIE